MPWIIGENEMSAVIQNGCVRESSFWVGSGRIPEGINDGEKEAQESLWTKVEGRWNVCPMEAVCGGRTLICLLGSTIRNTYTHVSECSIMLMCYFSLI